MLNQSEVTENPFGAVEVGPEATAIIEEGEEDSTPAANSVARAESVIITP